MNKIQARFSGFGIAWWKVFKQLGIINKYIEIKMIFQIKRGFFGYGVKICIQTCHSFDYYYFLCKCWFDVKGIKKQVFKPWRYEHQPWYLWRWHHPQHSHGQHRNRCPTKQAMLFFWKKGQRQRHQSQNQGKSWLMCWKWQHPTNIWK